MPVLENVYNVGQAKTNLSGLLGLVEQGNEVIIAKRNQPMFKICLLQNTPKHKRKLGFVDETIPQSFFDPMPEGDLQAWGL